MEPDLGKMITEAIEFTNKVDCRWATEFTAQRPCLAAHSLASFMTYNFHLK